MPRKTSLTKEKIEVESGIKLLEPLTLTNKKHRFECPFCKSEFMTTPQKVHSRHTKSCGCTSLGKRTGSKYFSGDFLHRCRKGAKERNIEWLLTKEVLDSIMEEQGFRCNLSGRELTYGYIPLGDISASIDRVDSSKPYVEDNIQILHKHVNLAKQSYSQNYFILLCKEVAQCN